MDSRSSWRPDPTLKVKDQLRKIKTRNIYELQHNTSSRTKLSVINKNATGWSKREVSLWPRHVREKMTFSCSYSFIYSACIVECHIGARLCGGWWRCSDDQNRPSPVSVNLLPSWGERGKAKNYTSNYIITTVKNAL